MFYWSADNTEMLLDQNKAKSFTLVERPTSKLLQRHFIKNPVVYVSGNDIPQWAKDMTVSEWEAYALA
ncbi:hypothetical protein [Vibrio mediterranei]|uniref:hypothetical protein n=1 Tax=Vibrio mediterranei TaxID=689 RepID=UPI0040689EB6